MEIREEHCVISTGMKEDFTKKLNYKWTIRNFNEFDGVGRMRTISSPLFRTSNSQDYLKILPHGTDSYDFISIALVQNNETVTRSNVNFYILINQKQLTNKTKATRVDPITFSSDAFIRRDVLFDPAKNLLTGNDLTVVCTFSECESVDHVSSDIEIECQKCKNNVGLSNDLQKLLKNELLTDITLLANDKKLHAHKSILIARSPVFAAMLANDMKEKIESEIKIQDFNADVLSEMLHFMYTDKVTSIKDHFQDLLCVANMYDIQGLKHICEEFMLSELTIENVIQVFMLSESQNCTSIRPKILKFIIQNAVMIIQSSQFELREKDLPSWLIDTLKAVTE